MLSVPASALREKTEKENLDELRRFSWNMYFFYQSFPQEKIFLQLDNTAYFQGETIWFKGYVVNSENLKRTQSGVLYVELISPNGVILEQKKVRIIAGQCDGNFRLYDSSTEQARELRGIQPYPSGFYEIRAYTQNMLDFDDRACFSRVIPIYRAPEYEGKYEDPVITYMDSPIEQRRPDTEIPEDVNVEFFPEGGHLINGIPTRIAFKCTDKSGENIDGVLSFRKGDAEGVRTVHDGMGAFLYIPGKNDNHVIFRTGEKDYNFTLPKAEASGYSLKADIMTDNDLQLRILHTKDRKEGSIGVSVTCRGKLIYFKEFLSSSDTLMNVSMKNWPLGVCRIDRKSVV